MHLSRTISLLAISSILTGLVAASPFSIVANNDIEHNPITRLINSNIADTSEYVIGTSSLVKNVRTFKPILNLPSSSSTSATTLLQRPALSATHRIPHTDITLIIRKSGFPITVPHSTLRLIISACLTEVDSILDIAGDGIIPGPQHAYEKARQIVHAADVERIELKVESTQPRGPAEELMTYGILRDTLSGLWDWVIMERQQPDIGSFWIQKGERRVAVGLGYLSWGMH